jgi:hypothetical protein
MTAVCAWFLASRVGRYCAAALAIVVVIGGVILKLMAMGRAQERAAQTAGRLKAISKRKASDDKVDAMGASVRERQLDGWMRDDGKR